MRPTIFEIPLGFLGTLAIAPRPRGGDWLEVDISALSAHGVNLLVSLLERDEGLDLGLEQEFALCTTCGIEFLSLPVPDLGVPRNSAAFVAAAIDLAASLRGGKYIAAHCRQSVGRSGLFAVSVAVAAGVELDQAVEAVSRARGVRVPETAAQMEWLRRHESQLAGLTG